MSAENQETALQHRSPAEMIYETVQKGGSLENMERLLDIQMKWEANEARKAYHKAMAEFKANAPTITKDKRVSYALKTGGRQEYNHASLANVCRTINAELSKYGLSAGWRTSQENQIQVTCTITHELGHSESTTLSAASDTSGSKNPIQAIGSTISYLERYTLLALTGLATEEQDDDAQAVASELVNEKELGILIDFITQTETNTEKFCQAFKIESLESLPKSQFPKAKSMLQAKMNRVKK